MGDTIVRSMYEKQLSKFLHLKDLKEGDYFTIIFGNLGILRLAKKNKRLLQTVSDEFGYIYYLNHNVSVKKVEASFIEEWE